MSKALPFKEIKQDKHSSLYLNLYRILSVESKKQTFTDYAVT